MDLNKLEAIMTNSRQFHAIYNDPQKKESLNGNDWEKLAKEAHNDRDALIVMISDMLEHSPLELRRSFQQIAGDMRNGTH